MLDAGLYVVATPIGNLKDISERALEVLGEADVIACEDTRVSKKLFGLIGLKADKQFICYEDHNEEDKAQAVADLILEGLAVALISDAGSPLISDPGYKLVRLCRQKGLAVKTIPGASAVICALQLSGLPTNRFMFAGFIPNKEKAKNDLFEELCPLKTTLVFYETALRLAKTLETLAKYTATREIAVAREITKIYEECKNGTALELLEYYKQNPPKGEIVLMVAPPEKQEFCAQDIKEELKKQLKKTGVKSAVQEVVQKFGGSKKEIYRLALELKNDE